MLKFYLQNLFHIWYPCSSPDYVCSLLLFVVILSSPSIWYAIIYFDWLLFAHSRITYQSFWLACLLLWIVHICTCGYQRHITCSSSLTRKHVCTKIVMSGFIWSVWWLYVYNLPVDFCHVSLLMIVHHLTDVHANHDLELLARQLLVKMVSSSIFMKYLSLFSWCVELLQT